MDIRWSPEVAAQLDTMRQRETWDPSPSPLEAAVAQYRTRLEELAAIRPCLEAWDGDPPGPDYVGTRCQLLEGHVQRQGTRHRHRMLGSQATVEWD